MTRAPVPVLSCPEVMDTEDVAKVLKIPVKTVRMLIARGDLPAKKVGRSYRVTRTHLEKYLK